MLRSGTTALKALELMIHDSVMIKVLQLKIKGVLITFTVVMVMHEPENFSLL